MNIARHALEKELTEEGVMVEAALSPSSCCMLSWLTVAELFSVEELL